MAWKFYGSDKDWYDYAELGQLEEFYQLMPKKLTPRQDKILYAFYDLRREVESGHRIKSKDIDRVLTTLPYEEDCAKIIIQMIDDYYIEIYAQDLQARTQTNETKFNPLEVS